MTTWNEDNFLEKLMPSPRQNPGPDPDGCPDAETLCAAMEAEAGDPLRRAIAEHLMKCPACADLHSRLLNFDRGGEPEQEAEWQQTKKRLDNWLEGFLASEAAHGRSAKESKPARSVLGWESIPNFFGSRKVIWALGTAVALVLTVNGVLLLEFQMGPVRLTQEAHVPPVLPAPPLHPAPAEKPPEASAEKPKTTPQEEGSPQVAEKIPSGAESPNSLRGGRPSGRAAPQSAPAFPSVREAIADEVKSQLAAEQAAAANPTGTSPQTVAESNRTIMNRIAHLPAAPYSGHAASAKPTPSRSFGAERALVAQVNPASQALGLPPSPPATLNQPATFRLEAGTRVWIRLNSVPHQPGGTFAFAGSLHMQLSKAGAPLLDPGTTVNGYAMLTQGRALVFVREFAVGGTHYVLKGAAAKGAEMPGAGTAVEFQGGQVLEMFLAADSVYEKMPDSEGQTPQR